MLSDKKSVTKKLTLKELEHQLWMAAHIITGLIDASDYKTYIRDIRQQSLTAAISG